MYISLFLSWRCLYSGFSKYLGWRGLVKNFLKTVFKTLSSTILNSSTIIMFALADLLFSELVLVFIQEVFLKDITASFWPILHFSISEHNMGDLFIKSSCIFNKTSFACFSVPELTTILVPGNRIHRTQQKRAVKYVLPCNCCYLVVFYPQLWKFPSFASVGQFQLSLAYIFTYDFTFRWNGLVGRLYLFTTYALRWATAFRNLCFTSVLAYLYINLAFTDFPFFLPTHFYAAEPSKCFTFSYFLFKQNKPSS